MSEFTHLNANGHVHMVDVGDKDITRREASAEGQISMSPECFEAIRSQTVKKGDVLATARVAGIMGAKKTSDLIPLCHPLQLTHVSVDFTLHPEDCTIRAIATTACTGKTGVEMEALSAVCAALLTIYDMCKAIDRSMAISQVHLVTKSGGRSGDFIYGEDM